MIIKIQELESMGPLAIEYAKHNGVRLTSGDFDIPIKHYLKMRVTPASDWRGLGDVVASATKAIGIKPCGGCQKRQETLNRLVPFKVDKAK